MTSSTAALATTRHVSGWATTRSSGTRATHSDAVDGQDDGITATLLFNGANVNENINIADNGGHAKFTRDVANITTDLDNVETIDFEARGGADNITVNDLSNTDVRKVKIDLGGADNQVDTVVLNATDGDDNVTIKNINGVVTVSGLGAEVTITGFESTDRLVINGLGGDEAMHGAPVSPACCCSPTAR